MKNPAESDLYLASKPKVARIPASGDDAGHQGKLRRALNCDDVLRTVMRFVGERVYLPLASVSTRWRGAWGQRLTLTTRRWAVQSCSCFDWARASGLDIWDNPCLHAAAEGRLNVLQHAVSLGYSRTGMAICEHAAGGGHLDVVQWCRANGYPWRKSSFEAARGGHLEVLKWCVANGSPLRVPLAFNMDHSTIMRAATMGEQLDIVRWCREQGEPWDPEICYLAAKQGHFELLKWMRANGCPWCPRTMEGAVEANCLEILMWCDANGCPWSPDVPSAAVWGGNLDVIQWCVAHRKSTGLDGVLCDIAAAEGNLEALKWLRANGCPWGELVCWFAACNLHFDMLRWCVANGCPWGSTERRPRDGFRASVAMMSWSIANKCPWMRSIAEFSSVCEGAASAGNLELLIWCGTFHELDGEVISMAAIRHNHIHILEWLQTERKLPMINGNCTLCSEAASYSSLETMQWCRSIGLPWSEWTCAAVAMRGDLRILQWCMDNGCPWDRFTCENAIFRDDFEMLSWCLAKGRPADISESRIAARGKEMVEWCKKYHCYCIDDDGREGREE